MNQQQENPIVEIFRESNGRFTVKIMGKEVERLRSFTVSVKNEATPQNSMEAPYYQIEQYFGSSLSQRLQNKLRGNLRDNRKGCIDHRP